MSVRGRRILTHASIILIAFAAGTCAGLILYPEVFQGVSDPDASAPVAFDDETGHGEIVELSKTAVANLGLELGKAQLGDHAKVQAFPGELVEIPGQSDLSVSAPLSGVIEFVSIRDGQSVSHGDTLFDLRITDQEVTKAQSELLSILSQIEIAETESKRLEPLVEEGAVPEKRTRDLSYELTGLKASRDTKIQEILARGLPKSTLDHVLKTKQLATRISIVVPNYRLRRVPSTTDFIREVSFRVDKPTYSIGLIHAHPGMAVSAGADLCDLSYHGRLYIRGQAFESDLDVITQLGATKEKVVAEFGHQHHAGHQHSTIQDNLLITHIDNHISPQTQTFSFFIPLENEVLDESTRDGRVYRQWRFRPGQRVHLRAPINRFTEKIKVPVGAVATAGPTSVVFRRFVHKHEFGKSQGHHTHAYLELEPIEVHVVHRDHDFAILEPGDLQPGDLVAMNGAYKLQLALRMAAGAAGGGHEGHNH